MGRRPSVPITHSAGKAQSGLRRRPSALLVIEADLKHEQRQPNSPGRQLQHYSTRRSGLAASGSDSPSPPRSAGSLSPPPTPRSSPLPSRRLPGSPDSCSSGSPQLSAALPPAVQLAAAEPLTAHAAVAPAAFELAAEAAFALQPFRQARRQQQRRRHKGVALMVLQLAATLWLALCAAALCLWVAATL